MRQLTIKLALPLTVILFSLVGKWWYVQVIDGQDEVMYGFPFAYTTRGFGSSMTVQYFMLELVMDFLIYFAVILGLVFVCRKLIFQLKRQRLLTSPLMAISIVFMTFHGYRLFMRENYFDLKRDFDVIAIAQGIDWAWRKHDRYEKRIEYDYYKFREKYYP
jgi:hypothetical protein